MLKRADTLSVKWVSYGLVIELRFRNRGMFSIDHIPSEEQVHFLRCGVCKEYFDCRDLSQVFAHEHLKPESHLDKTIGHFIERIRRISGKLRMGTD
jgi:hypothetical protein